MFSRCDECKHAEWKRTKAGRLHPDRSGKCKAELPGMLLPRAYYWGAMDIAPKPWGGGIERLAPPEECAFFEPIE